MNTHFRGLFFEDYGIHSDIFSLYGHIGIFQKPRYVKFFHVMTELLAVLSLVLNKNAKGMN